MRQNPNAQPAELSGQPAYTLNSSPPPGAQDMVVAPKYDGGSVITAWGSHPSQNALYQPQTPRSPMGGLQGPYGDPEQQAMYGIVAAGSQSRGQGQSTQPSSQSSGSPGSQGWADLAGSRTATPLGYERQWSGPAPGYEVGRGGRVGRRMVPGDMRDMSLSS